MSKTIYGYDTNVYETTIGNIEKLEKAMEGKSSYKDIIIENQQKKINKQKEVINKIKEIFKDYGVKEDIVDYSNYYISGESLIHILELLEEIE